ncbi:MAG TPA: hypothetical protein VHU82_03370, partial [Vicinamibacterales bacterium]|nr:hypothetical protein [Vicinamibacterales bacterium]
LLHRHLLEFNVPAGRTLVPPAGRLEATALRRALPPRGNELDHVGLIDAHTPTDAHGWKFTARDERVQRLRW